MDLHLLEIRTELDTGDAGKTACQVLDLLWLECAEFGKDTMFDLAVLTI